MAEGKHPPTPEKCEEHDLYKEDGKCFRCEDPLTGLKPLPKLPIKSDGFDGQPEVLGAMFRGEEIDRPAHYTEGRKYMPSEVIRDWGLNFFLGNALKYISRAGRKESALKDLKKARWYIEDEIAALEAEGG